MEDVLTSVFRNKSIGIEEVVEFGAGKFKNVPFLLAQGKKVTAVEFEENFKSPIAKENLRRSSSYGSRFRLMTPEQFEADNRRFDFELLANVLQTVPLESERTRILQLLHGKLKVNKIMLWFAQKDDPVYVNLRKEGRTCKDGVWRGDGRNFQTFFRYYSPEEAAGLAGKIGFALSERIATHANYALLFKKSQLPE